MSTTGWLKSITNEQVFRVLKWDELLPAIRSCLVAYTQGPDHPEGAVQPLRTWLEAPKHDGRMAVMPGLVTDKALAVKILNVYPGNTSRGLEACNVMVVLMHSDTGIPAAILQGEAITELRTAAASAVATLELYHGRKDLKDGETTVAVLGTGSMARGHARVMAHILKPKKIMVWGRRPEAAEELCATLCSEGISAVPAATIQEAVKDADVINNCTATTTPILKGEWVKSRAHINSIGAHIPTSQEMDEALVKAATIYTDSYISANAEAGDVIKYGATVFGELGEVILGRKPVLNDKITIYKSLGIGIQDAVAAQIVYQHLSDEDN